MASIILPVPHILQRQPGECLAACAAMILTYLALPWLAKDEYYAVITLPAK
ncbi:MAG: hypothetical protein HYR94_28815 [Chloroflexi bacterium]|nr:hypothetical protein [Chloroflexota bacterium]